MMVIMVMLDLKRCLASSVVVGLISIHARSRKILSFRQSYIKYGKKKPKSCFSAINSPLCAYPSLFSTQPTANERHSPFIGKIGPTPSKIEVDGADGERRVGKGKVQCSSLGYV